LRRHVGSLVRTLVPGIGEIAEHLGRHLGAFDVQIDQHVIQHQRQQGASPGIGGGQSQAKAQEHRFARALTQHVQRQDSPCAVSTRRMSSLSGVQTRW
jgi:hypothetical protein